MTGTPHSGPPVPRASAASAADGRRPRPLVEPHRERVERPGEAVGAIQHGLEHLDGRHLAARERGPELAGRDLADVHHRLLRSARQDTPAPTGAQCDAARRRTIARNCSVVRGNSSPVPQSTITPY